MPKIVRLSCMLLLASSLFAQTPKLQPSDEPPGIPEKPVVPTVTFTFDWPSIQPHHYVITVASTGRAAYQSWIISPGAALPAGTAAASGKPSDIAGDPYMLKFTMSVPQRERIFRLAERLNFFHGDFDFRKHRIASTGAKILAYADPDRHFETRYNWSQNPDIQELTAIFQGISTTIESGRRLAHLHRYDRLGLNQELKTMERLAAKRELAEIHVIAPVLQEIANDVSVMRIARQRTRRLLQMSEATSASAH